MKLLKGSLIALLIMMVLCYGTVTFMSLNESDHKPVIKCTSDRLLISCMHTEADLLRGITAYDEEDGDITEDILIGNFSKFTKPGVCKIKYAVFDSEKNYAEYERNVEFYDYESPKITLTGPLIFIENSNSDYTLRNYLRATDSLDGEVSKHIKIENLDVNYRNRGTYTVSVSLKNSFGDSVKLDLPIHVLENRKRGLGISLTQPLIYIGQDEIIEPKNYIGSIWREQDSQILPLEDCELEIKSGIDYSRPGVYQINYSAYASDKTLYGETWLTVVVGEYGG